VLTSEAVQKVTAV